MKIRTHNHMVGVAASLFLLAGCNNVRPVQIEISNLNYRYNGHDAKEFFYSYGNPSNEIVRKNGDIVYSWLSTHPKLSDAVPDTAAGTPDSPPNGNAPDSKSYSETDTHVYRAHDGDYDEETDTYEYKSTTTHTDNNDNDNDNDETPAKDDGKYCELEIRANREAIIQSISVVNDTPGKRSPSRCAEVLSTPSLL